MPLDIPVDFQQLASQSPSSTPVGAPPKTIRASDLMKNFYYTAMDADDSLIQLQTGQGGFQTRKLKIPAVPQSGTKILASVDGVLTWLSTEEC